MQNILPFLHNQTLLQALVEKTGALFLRGTSSQSQCATHADDDGVITEF
jgi:hypothetical protein